MAFRVDGADEIDEPGECGEAALESPTVSEYRTDHGDTGGLVQAKPLTEHVVSPERIRAQANLDRDPSARNRLVSGESARNFSSAARLVTNSAG